MAAHRKNASRKPWILTIALALLGAMFVIPASSNASDTSSGFGCQAVTGRLGSGHYGAVNYPDAFPCQSGYFGLSTLDLGFAQVTGLESFTSDYNGGSAYASAATVVITVGHVHITIQAVQASAKAGCSWLGSPYVASSSKVTGLRINGGAARVITGHTTINILGVVVLELNKTTYGYHTRTQQALVMSSSTTPGKFVIGEATAGYTGDPCLT